MRESELIRLYARVFGSSQKKHLPEHLTTCRKVSGTSGISLGVGDDCAVIPLSMRKNLLFTTDFLNENQHFKWDWISPQELGYKALAVNLSDIAAMGGRPSYALLTLSLPSLFKIKDVEACLSTMQTLAKSEGVQILGGDTVGSTQDLWSIGISLLGEVSPRQLKLRSTASPKDLICVTGCLGDSLAGLKSLENGLNKKLDPNSSTKKLILRHHRPKVYLREGQWLAQKLAVHAMMDVSDGLHADLGKLLQASGLRARVWTHKLPCSAELRSWYLHSQKQTAHLVGNHPLWQFAASGGEDYVLLLTVAEKSFKKLSDLFLKMFHTPLYAIGKVMTASSNSIGSIEYWDEHKKVPFQSFGFQHF